MTKSILITGSSSGIGQCAAETLHQRGYKVFAGVRKPEDQSRLLEQGIQGILLDLNDSKSIQTAVNTVLAKTDGHLDALFNNAGFGQPGAVEDLSRDSLRNQFETNVFGLQELTNLIVPIMRRQGHGRIINVSSVLGFIPMAYRGAYCASKYSLEALSETLNMELRGTSKDIYVSLIEPGPISSQFRGAARTAYQDNIHRQDSPHQRQYARILADFEKMKDKVPFIQPPDAVVKKLIHALESRKPKVRYYVTLPTYFFAILKRLLPSHLMEKILWQVSRQEMKLD